MKPFRFSIPTILLGVTFAVPLYAADCTVKILDQNDKVMVQETICAPGAGSPMLKRPMRVVHYIKGTTYKRTYEDGSTETVTFKDGETTILDIAKPYSYVNVGKTEAHMVSVAIK